MNILHRRDGIFALSFLGLGLLSLIHGMNAFDVYGQSWAGIFIIVGCIEVPIALLTMIVGLIRILKSRTEFFSRLILGCIILNIFDSIITVFLPFLLVEFEHLDSKIISSIEGFLLWGVILFILWILSLTFFVGITQKENEGRRSDHQT
ncbi:MAG: hypothetical protein ACW98F_19210 [Candidatus Hodarchaeales archaeon]|jgi:hypothetical protein